MTRRDFLTIPVLGIAVPAVGKPVESNGFIVSGVLQEAGDLGYWAIGTTVSLSVDPDRAPSMLKAGDALVGKQVEIVLRRAHPWEGEPPYFTLWRGVRDGARETYAR